MIDTLLGQVGDGSPIGPLLGLGVGVLLGLSPVALPSLPAVMAFMSPGQLHGGGGRVALPMTRAAPAVIAFVVGMDGVVAAVGYVFTELTVALVRASVVLYLIAAAVMGVIGVRLLMRRTSLCHRAQAIPPRPVPAFFAGIAFSIGGCPGCAPISLGVGSAAAVVGGAGYALTIIAAFVAGRALVLLVAGAVGSRLLKTDGLNVPWLRLDLVVGVLFVAASAYYLYRVFTGKVTTRLPGEPGSGILP